LPAAPGRKTADRSRNCQNLKPAPIGHFIEFLLRARKPFRAQAVVAMAIAKKRETERSAEVIAE
jgi:hypothetical protein